MSRHVHQWVALPKQPRALSKRKFRCAHPECYSMNYAPVLVGKLSICTACSREFVLTIEDLRRNKPVCLYCANTKEGREFRIAAAAEAKALEAEIFATFEVDPENQIVLNLETKCNDGGRFTQ